MVLRKHSMYTLIFFFLACINSTPFSCIPNKQPQEQDTFKKAYEYFAKAQFDESLKLYKKAYDENPDSYEANYRIGYLYMLSNKHSVAEKHLKKAIEIEPDKKEPKMRLAEVLYRQDRYKEAAPIFEEMGDTGKAKQLFSFGSRTPNKIVGDLPETFIPFMMIDPLPIFKIKVNGKEIVVLLDTGGSDIIIDSEFAKEIGVKSYGSHEAVFAGDKKGTIEFGAVESVQFGDYKVENVPVDMLPLRKMLRLGGLELNGIVGTAFLYHFLSTIDYPGEKLILNRYGTDFNDNKLKMNKEIRTTFWMAGDHFILTWGTANKSKPLFLFMDTGLAGGAFSFSRSVAEEKIGIQIDESKAATMMGGGGAVKVYPITLEEMTLGKARVANLSGDVSKMPGIKFEFPIDGIISHNFFKNYSVTFDFQKMEVIMIQN